MQRPSARHETRHLVHREGVWLLLGVRVPRRRVERPDALRRIVLQVHLHDRSPERREQDSEPSVDRVRAQLPLLNAGTLRRFPLVDVPASDLVDVPVSERRDQVPVLRLRPALAALRRLQLTRAELSLEQGRRVVAVLRPLAPGAPASRPYPVPQLRLFDYRLLQRNPLELPISLLQRARPRIDRAHAHAISRLCSVNARVLRRLAAGHPVAHDFCAFLEHRAVRVR